MFSKKTYKAQNSRRFKRFRADYLVKFQVSGTEGEPYVSNLKDLSAGGAKFWTEQFLVEGTLVKLNFLVPPLDREVQALARVVRVRQAAEQSIYYAAVRFLEMPEDAKNAINEFVENLSQIPDAKRFVSAAAPVVKRNITL